MKINYELGGMSFGGCVNSVKKLLLQHPDVEEAEVHLQPQSAVLTMRRFIDVNEITVAVK
jgi:copper chaperone CopZ